MSLHLGRIISCIISFFVIVWQKSCVLSKSTEGRLNIIVCICRWKETAAFSLGSLFCRNASWAPVHRGLGEVAVSPLFIHSAWEGTDSSWAIQTPVQASLAIFMVRCITLVLSFSHLYLLSFVHIYARFFLLLCFPLPLWLISSSVFTSLPRCFSFSFCMLPRTHSPESFLIPFWLAFYFV